MMNNYNSGMPTYANGGGLEQKIKSLEAEKKKLIEEWKIATGAEKDKLYKKWQDVGIDLSYAQRDMYRNQEIEERNKMTIDFMKALEEDGIMTPGSHKNKANVDSIKSIISMDGYEFSKYIKKVKDRKIDGIYREFQDWKQTYHSSSMMANGGGVDMAAQGMFLDGEFEEIVRKTKDYISKYPYVWKSGNKSYVPIEGWQYAASLMGLSARVTEVYAVPGKNGWMAKAEVVNQSGVVVCSGFGFVGRDEEKWAKSTESDLESFAQTKAVSRALRNGISYLIKAAGYSTTPAEEMYGLKGISKSMSYKKPKLPPIYGVPDSDFIFDRPEYRPERPVQKPIEKAVTKERSNLSILLQKVWAESKGRGMVIVSPEFMDKIEGTLFDADATDLVFEVLLTDAYEWMISNNKQLRSKRFMNEIQRAISGLGN